ncbi:DinB family protein [Chitinophaga qingshengii]|uniref:DinB family protein n=1 Tax=Chitinophaga qingshengii TaxID=1569794 RepID=A0ABR7TLD8_9BACT|nr:DinB family protein [Chitinophaga qingshengii]MBC9929874.1 DinB family protein [Chitinophaga qingshengii]
MRQQLIIDVENTRTLLLDTLSTFAAAEIDKQPFEGSWSPGQVAEHIAKASDCAIVYGNVAPTERPADAQVQAIRDVFLDFTQKFSSPEMILPTQTSHEKEALLNDIRRLWDKLKLAAETVDLEDTCLDFVVYGFEPFTRLEWIQFINIHAQRHVHQLQNIKTRLIKAG